MQIKQKILHDSRTMKIFSPYDVLIINTVWYIVRQFTRNFIIFSSYLGVNANYSALLSSRFNDFPIQWKCVWFSCSSSSFFKLRDNFYISGRVIISTMRIRACTSVCLSVYLSSVKTNFKSKSQSSIIILINSGFKGLKQQSLATEI